MQRRGIKGRLTEEGKSVFVGNREASSCSARSMLDLHSDMMSDDGIFLSSLIGMQDFSTLFLQICAHIHQPGLLLALDELSEGILQ